jgi:hypothetical protein
LRDDEEAEWLARATWRLDTSDGRLLVMGGFDPDLLALWRDESGRGANVRGVALFDVGPGSWRVDVYAHAGSMNGRQILSEADVKPGAAFRRSHPGRPFPLWLAKMLEFSADADPGHEDDWQDLQASVESGRLAVDTNDVSTIGFVVHVMPWTGPVPEPPETGWFPRDVNRRLPATFPLGLTSDVRCATACSVDPSSSPRARRPTRSCRSSTRGTAIRSRRSAHRRCVFVQPMRFISIGWRL